MNGLSVDNFQEKPLPVLTRDESLPPLPPAASSSLNASLPPLPNHPSPLSFSSNIPLSDLGIPPTPTTPLTPSASQQDGRPKKSNPLTDLIDTERAYVDHLAGVIRKVAAAWSRSNLPPPELDAMFRSIEGVYKANRTLNNKLKEIGTNPSSPKALGDLLMRWIDDLEAPYTAYCTKFCTGFDSWDPVQANAKLGGILQTFSGTNPPPSSIVASDPPMWTLDTLFLLPRSRLKYYKKLYGRLLKNTAPGKSDHPLLVRAIETLERLLETLDGRSTVLVSDIAIPPPQTEDEVVVDMRNGGPPVDVEPIVPAPAPAPLPIPPSTGPSSPRGSGLSNRDVVSIQGSISGSVSGSTSRASSSTMSSPIIDLERRLLTQRTLDIFTMNLKSVRLQMCPPGLTFTRELRFSLDVVIRFTPRATEQEVIHRFGHVFLLSDLFLVCERMTPEERAQHGGDGADMWLCYPPLAGKVLRVTEVEGQGNCLQIAVMRKEHLTLEAESPQARDFMMREFKDCIDFASSLPPPSKQPPPPMPPLPNFAQPAPLAPGRGGPLPPNPGMPRSMSSNPLPGENRIVDGMARLALSPEAQMQQGAQRMPIMHNGPPPRGPGPPGPPQMYPPNGFGPGQMMHPGPPGRPSLGGRPSPGGPGMGPGPMGYGHPPPGPPLMHMGGPLPPPNAPFGVVGGPPRPPSEPSMQDGLRKMPSTRSLASHDHGHGPLPPPPPMPGFSYNLPRNGSSPNLQAPQPRTVLPSAQFNTPRAVSMAEPMFDEPSPPNSPVAESRQNLGPVTSTISAQMKCKIFLQQQHAQWKSLGAAKLKLYRQDPTNVKQLVVEADSKDKTVLISTIVLTDGVERVGKTGVAIELSDQGARTGIIYMIQLRNEKSAGGLFESLLAGSDRAGKPY
ncbi:hypothetical protein BDN72DRAFT_830181 [Pluteus cervinus]|uniref:Uncharacterized protein n=1 Tax=Pluteus cervinus TaxID=181527 RepID=A0ACD3BH93_9AGAR|nr:hypothetical protein BDN72DRAFT_830181 [Pluteus cervinus]